MDAVCRARFRPILNSQLKEKAFRTTELLGFAKISYLQQQCVIDNKLTTSVTRPQSRQE